MTDLEGQPENNRIIVFEIWPEVPESEGEYSSFEDPDFEEGNFESLASLSSFRSLESLESGYPSVIDDLEPFLDEDYLESLEVFERGDTPLIDDLEPFLPDPFLPDVSVD